MFKPTANLIPRFSLLFAVVSLAACGGSSSSGGSGPTPGGVDDPAAATAPVEPGFFTTSVTHDSGAPDQDAFALISSTGQYAFFTDGVDGIFGTVAFGNEDTFTGGAENVFLDETWQSVDGSVQGNSISAEQFNARFTASTAEGDAGTDITGNRSNTVSDRSLTMEELSATYSLSGSDQTTAVTIGSDGSVTGSETVTGSDPDKGCIISGSVEIPDAAYNIFEGNLSLTNCASIEGATSEQRNGEYPVIGFLNPVEDGPGDLVFVGTNSDVIFLFIGAR